MASNKLYRKHTQLYINPNDEMACIGNKNGRSDGYSDCLNYLEKFQMNESEPYATRFVREMVGKSYHVGFRDSEVNRMELPPYYSKRKIYQMYCYSLGYKVKSDSRGSYPKMIDYKNYLLPDCDNTKPVVSFSTFLVIWKNNYPFYIFDLLEEISVYHDIYLETKKSI